jgi:UDPglucose 6-dehydrogenase
MVRKNHENGDLHFTKDLKEGLDNSDVCFIAVGTPMGEKGCANLKYVLEAAKDVGRLMSHDMIVVDKSTVPVGTADNVKNTINKELKKRDVNYKVNMVSNPEFLKEGAAVENFMRPDRVVIGSDDEEVTETMRDIHSAEMTKYAANAMLATRISFMNEIANICESVGADINKVRLGIGSDKRIGYSFLYAGCGYGGSCFPKDVRALIKTSADHGYYPSILREVDSVNNKQKMVLVNKVRKRFGEDLSGRSFALWGLSFKPETDDMREATSLVVVNELTRRGAKIQAYDPKAMDAARKYYFKDNTNVEFSKSKYDAVDGADALLLVTEWKEFRSPDFDEIVKRMKNRIIFDGRNQYNKEMIMDIGFEYHQIGNKN